MTSLLVVSEPSTLTVGCMFKQLLLCCSFCAAVLLPAARCQNALVDVRGVIYTPEGQPFAGTATVVPMEFPTGTKPPQIIVLVENGMLFVRVPPTTGLSANACYRVMFKSSDHSASWFEVWRVPEQNHLSLNDVRVSQPTPRESFVLQDEDKRSGGTDKDITLPIAMTDVAGLNVALNQINASLSALSITMNVLSSQVQEASSATAGIVVGEIPRGSIDGVNPTFVLSAAPGPTASLCLYRNGQLQKLGFDYSLNVDSISFSARSIPHPGDQLLADYRKSVSPTKSPLQDNKAISLPIPISGVSGLSAALNQINIQLSNLNTTASGLGSEVQALGLATSIYGEIPAGAINGQNAEFRLGQVPLRTDSVAVWNNGLREEPGKDFTITGNILTFSSNAVPQIGDVLLVNYSASASQP